MRDRRQASRKRAKVAVRKAQREAKIAAKEARREANIAAKEAGAARKAEARAAREAKVAAREARRETKIAAKEAGAARKAEARAAREAKIAARQARASPERRLEAEVLRVQAEVARLAQQPGPVLAGPFLGEVGYELLQWIPFLHWAVREFPALRGRLVVVSRGGTASWFDGLDARYVDVFSLISPEELVSRRPGMKQREISELDGELIERAAQALELEQFSMLHPSLFYGLHQRVKRVGDLFSRAVVHERSGSTGFLAFYRPLSPPPHPIVATLPRDYVAVRFYSRPTFPDTPELRAFAAATVAALARRFPVVLLDTGIEVDEHRALVEPADGRVLTLTHAMSPESNLHVQTAVLGGARAFVGTYGGLSYLAPFLGVPSFAFSSMPVQNPWHLELAQRVFEHPRWASLVVLQPKETTPEGAAALVDELKARTPAQVRARGWLGPRPWVRLPTPPLLNRR